MSTTLRVCVVGSTNVDVTARAPRLPFPGETLAGTDCTTGFGGKGANQAVMAARLGATVRMVGRVGADAFGRQALDNFHHQRIDAAFVGVDPVRPTGAALIIVDATGQNSIVVVPGANGALTADHVRGAAEAVTGSQVVLAQLETPQAATLEALRIARSAGARTVLNPAPAAALDPALLPLTDLLVPNETELADLTDRGTGTLDDIEAAARSFLARGVGAVVVTLAERGALVVDRSGSEHVPAVPVTAVDTTGAGDAFIGSVAVFLTEGQNLPTAVRSANAVAALAVTRPGTQSSFPLRAELPARW